MLETQKQARRRVLLEPDSDGNLAGRDPRDLTAEQWAEAGIEPSSPTAAIRAKCVDCSGGSVIEARKCVAVGCPLWAFRMGRNPFRAPATDEQRAKSAENMRRLQAKRHAADLDA